MQEIIPAAVREQQEKADAAQKDLIKKVEPAPISDEKQEDEKPEEEKPAQQKEEDWEHRYKVLKGKYDAEISAKVPKFKDNINELQEQLLKSNATIQDLNEVIQGLQQAEKEEPATEENDGSDGPVDLEEFDGWGEEVVNLGKEINRQNSIIERQGEIIQELRGYQDSSVKKQQEEVVSRFWGELRKGVPDCDSINSDPSFIKWLEGIDESSGFKRNDLLQHSYNMQDIPRVTNMFNAYKKENGRLNTIPGGDDISGQVMPSGSGTGPVVKAPGRTPSAAELSAAAQNFTKGKITQEEFSKISRAWQRGNAKGER